MKQKADIFRYGAGACFALLAILQFAMYSFDFSTLLRAMAFLLMAASFFAQIPTLGTVGGGLHILLAVIQFVPSIRLYIERYKYTGWYSIREITYIINALLLIAAYVIFLIMTLKRGNAKRLGYTAAAAVVVRRLVNFLGWGFYVPYILILSDLLLSAAGFLLAGFAYVNMTLESRKPAASTRQNTVADSIQRLENLQRLLEQGIITQEEFDAKKKQLLGL